jgi:hypothetical protein
MLKGARCQAATLRRGSWGVCFAANKLVKTRYARAILTVAQDALVGPRRGDVEVDAMSPDDRGKLPKTNEMSDD